MSRMWSKKWITEQWENEKRNNEYLLEIVDRSLDESEKESNLNSELWKENLNYLQENMDLKDRIEVLEAEIEQLKNQIKEKEEGSKEPVVTYAWIVNDGKTVKLMANFSDGATSRTCYTEPCDAYDTVLQFMELDDLVGLTKEELKNEIKNASLYAY